MAPIAAILALALLPASLGMPNQRPLGSWNPWTPNPAPPPDHAETPADMERYDNHEVWRIDWSGVELWQKGVLQKALEYDGDIWKATPDLIDVHLPPSAAKRLPSLLPEGAQATRLVSDLQALVNLSFAHAEPSPDLTVPTPEMYTTSALLEDPPTDLPDGGWNVSSLDSVFHNAFQPLAAADKFLDQLAEEFPEFLHSFEIGRSAEDRPIRGFTAHNATGKYVPEFVVISGQHAREWVGPASSIYFLHALLIDAKADHRSTAAKLIREFRITLFPTINPDGYVYSREHSRMWRKNRQEVGGLLCKGIDLNTNWGYEFRPSRLACSESYSGQTPFEAPETAAVANYVVNGTSDAPRKHNVRAFIDLHSYGQLFMFPYSFSCNVFPPDAENLMEAGIGVARAIRLATGQGYQTGQACQSTLRFAGDAADFTYAVGKARWSYSAELRDTGTYGFMLPPFLIRPTGIDVVAGLSALALFIYNTEIEP